MREVVLLGAGKIGRMIAALLSSSGDYDVLVGDIDEQRLGRVATRERVTTKIIDVADRSALNGALEGRDSVVSAQSFQFNVSIAEAAAANGLSYFDLTEDVATARRIRSIADSAAPRPGVHAAVRPGARLRLDRGERPHASFRPARLRAHACRRVAAVPDERAASTT